MPDHTVTLLRPRPASGYTDTAALNDIHAILTATGTGDGALADMACTSPSPSSPARAGVFLAVQCRSELPGGRPRRRGSPSRGSGAPVGCAVVVPAAAGYSWPRAADINDTESAQGTLGARVRGSARGRGRASARPAPLLRVKHPQSSAGNARTGALAGVAWGPRIVMRITSSAHTSKIAATRNEVAMPCVST
jgi:hypothetical protein